MRYGRAVIGRIELNGGSSAIVSISGWGRGTSPEKLTEVFDPFFTIKQQGVGIGLSMARSIVQAHKARIWAENHPEGRYDISSIDAVGEASGGEVGGHRSCR
jgi:signal transduction histidine kinase